MELAVGVLWCIVNGGSNRYCFHTKKTNNQQHIGEINRILDLFQRHDHVRF